MKEIQKRLNFPVSVAAKLNTPQKSKKLLGRPRRIPTTFKQLTQRDWKTIINKLPQGVDENGNLIGTAPAEVFEKWAIKPEIIKASVAQAVVAQLNRVRSKLEGGATLPDTIRSAILELIASGKDISIEGKRKQDPGRLKYIKIPLAGETVEAIGYWDLSGKDESLGSGLCAKYKVTRQQLINFAIKVLLEDFGL